MAAVPQERATSPGYLADALITLMKRGHPIMELQIHENQKLSYRSPKGYEHHDDDYVVRGEDIQRLMKFAAMGRYDPMTKIVQGQYDDVLTVEGKYRLRVNFYRTRGLLAASVRCLPVNVPEFDSLGAPAQLRNVMDRASAGLLLVVGPVGSGKSTTLATLINHYNDTRSGHIITLEEPIEYEFESRQSRISQREIPHDVATFADGLKGAKRQHADVILVGELRDPETVKTAFQAAEAGALVLASTHSDSAVSTIETLLSYFEGNEEREHARSVLANNLRAICSQRLVPSVNKDKFVLACEYLARSPATVQYIRENKIAQLRGSIEQGGHADGTCSMNDTLAGLVQDGQIAQDEALRVSNNRDALAKKLGVMDE